MQLYNFASIPPPSVTERIYARMGFREGKTKVSQEKIDLYERYMREALGLLELKGVAARWPITRRSPVRVEIGEAAFDSKLLASLAGTCGELLGMAVTAGAKIVEAIHSCEKNDLTRSVVYDATASEVVDGCFDWIQKYMQQTLRPENRQLLAKRISCGYADFSLSNQKIFFQLLQLDTLGITLTESFMLVPEKSASAVTGILAYEK